MNTEIINMDINDIKRGFVKDEALNSFICNLCGEQFAEGEIFKVGERYFSACAAAHLHIKNTHGSMSDILSEGGKNETGLPESLGEVVRLMSVCESDREIADRMGTSASTVRHQKFVLRQKVRQAKTLISLYELTNENNAAKSAEDTPVPIHNNAKMVDERYNVTEAERDKILQSVFDSLEPLRLRVFSAKEKKKLVALTKIAECFEEGRTYTEKEVNAVLDEVYYDYVTLRRYLIEYGFLDRKPDGSEYWKAG